MQSREWTTVDKDGWGEGPWQQEPDKVQWPDEVTGLPCLAVRNEVLGHWCGYVGVARDHPLYRAKRTARRVEKLSVHGGVTFAAACDTSGDESRWVCHVPDPGEPDHVWWFGFHCGEIYDLSPGHVATMAEVASLSPIPVPRRIREAMASLYASGTYKTLDYVREECADLAEQLRKLK